MGIGGCRVAQLIRKYLRADNSVESTLHCLNTSNAWLGLAGVQQQLSGFSSYDSSSILERVMYLLCNVYCEVTLMQHYNMNTIFERLLLPDSYTEGEIS